MNHTSKHLTMAVAAVAVFLIRRRRAAEEDV